MLIPHPLVKIFDASCCQSSPLLHLLPFFLSRPPPLFFLLLSPESEPLLYGRFHLQLATPLFLTEASFSSSVRHLHGRTTEEEKHTGHATRYLCLSPFLHLLRQPLLLFQLFVPPPLFPPLLQPTSRLSLLFIGPKPEKESANVAKVIWSHVQLATFLCNGSHPIKHS